MSEKPEALRLAEVLMSRAVMTTDQRAHASDKLLRQHAEIERLKAERDEAVKAEREACAKVIEAQDVDPAFKHRLAAAIRARGEVPR